MFAIKMTCAEIKGELGRIITNYGEKAWVVDDCHGPTSRKFDDNLLPKNLTLFSNKEDADKFMANWVGHPWYYKCSGEYEVLKVEDRYIKYGYKVKEEG